MRKRGAGRKEKKKKKKRTKVMILQGRKPTSIIQLGDNGTRPVPLGRTQKTEKKEQPE